MWPVHSLVSILIAMCYAVVADASVRSTVSRRVDMDSYRCLLPPVSRVVLVPGTLECAAVCMQSPSCVAYGTAAQQTSVSCAITGAKPIGATVTQPNEMVDYSWFTLF